MNSLARARIVVVGAGVLGLATAAAVIRRGARVQLFDPDLGKHSASAAAAGMIAPAMEAVREGADLGRANLYRDAAALWPAFSDRYELGFLEEAADWMGSREDVALRLAALGFAYEARADRLRIAGEGRVDVASALERLAGIVGDGMIATRVEAIEAGPSVIVGGRRIGADAVVVAAGWSAGRIPGFEALGEAITPVKGQIIALAGPGASSVQRVTRGPSVYLLPTREGVLAGATMEPGVDDTSVDPAVAQTLHQAAVRLVPELAESKVSRAWAGVRGATADGLPLVGASRQAGVFVALAPRRNGWLLAPLIGEILAATIAGEDPGPHAPAFRPDRFDPA